MYRLTSLGAISPSISPNVAPGSFFDKILNTITSQPRAPFVPPRKRKCVTRVVHKADKTIKVTDCRCAPVMVRRPGAMPMVRWVCPPMPAGSAKGTLWRYLPPAPRCPAGYIWSPVMSPAAMSTTMSRSAMSGLGGACIPAPAATGQANEEVVEEQVQTVSDENQVPAADSVVTDTSTPDNVVDTAVPPTTMPEMPFFERNKQKLMFGAALVGGFALITKLLG